MAQDYAKKVLTILDMAERAEAEAEGLAKAGNVERAGEVRAAAANYRAKAEDLMRQFRIEEESLIASDPTSVEPISINIDVCEYGSPFYGQYGSLFRDVAYHTGLRCRLTWGKSEAHGGYTLIAQCVGYESDVRYAQYLFASARLVFAERIEPKIKPELSDAENCYRLRSAGIERNRIAHELWGASMGSDGAHAHGKVGKLYKEASIARGEDPKLNGRSINAKTFREVYANSFVTHLDRRLRDARMAADSVGGALNLHGRQERVDEAFYQRFPDARPVAGGAVVKSEPCDPCKRTKHSSGKCKAHRPYEPTQADEARWYRQNYSATALAGKSAGKDAARAVELDRSAKAKRLGEDDARTTVRDVTGLELED